jgi:hypothetical protein
MGDYAVTRHPTLREYTTYRIWGGPGLLQPCHTGHFI